MLGFIKKSIQSKALDVDTKNRKVKVAISEMESMDRDGEIIARSAFTKTISEKGPKGSNEVWHLLDHHASLKSALSKFSELYTEGNKLVGVSEYRDSFAWREVAWPAYEAGDITQHSIGFSVIKSEKGKMGYEDTRIITEVALWEGSAVLWGANPNTPTLEVAKSLGIYNEDNEPETKIEKMLRAIKSDKFDNEAKELFIIELRQLQQDLYDLKEATSPQEEGTKPERMLDMDMIARAFI